MRGRSKDKGRTIKMGSSVPTPTSKATPIHRPTGSRSPLTTSSCASHATSRRSCSGRLTTAQQIKKITTWMASILRKKTCLTCLNQEISTYRRNLSFRLSNRARYHNLSTKAMKDFLKCSNKSQEMRSLTKRSTIWWSHSKKPRNTRKSFRPNLIRSRYALTSLRKRLRSMKAMSRLRNRRRPTSVHFTSTNSCKIKATSITIFKRSKTFGLRGSSSYKNTKSYNQTCRINRRMRTSIKEPKFAMKSNHLRTKSIACAESCKSSQPSKRKSLITSVILAATNRCQSWATNSTD